MAKPRPSWSLRLASCSLFVCIIQTMAWIVKAGGLSESSVDLASCAELQCANNNACQMSFINGTQSGHARCLCRGQWAGFRCRERISVHVAMVTTESVTLSVEGRGPPNWNAELRLEDVLVQQLSVTFWNLNQSRVCNVIIFGSAPSDSFRVGGLGRGQEFLFCIGNGPSDLCSSNSPPGSDDSSSPRTPNCVRVSTKHRDDAPLDIGLVVVPVACIVFVVAVVVACYLKRNSLFVHFILHYFCCRACYCCRRRCLRNKIQKMRKKQQEEQQHHRQDSSGVLLHHGQGTAMDDSTTFDMASTSLSSSVLGNRSSIKSDSYRSARSVDSDATIPLAYQDESNSGYFYTTNSLAHVTKRSASHDDDFPAMSMKRKVSDASFDPDAQNVDVVFRRHSARYSDRATHTGSIPRYPNGYPGLYYSSRREHYFCADNHAAPSFLLPSCQTPPYQAWLGEDHSSLPRSETFPATSNTLPGKIRAFPIYSKDSPRRSTITGIRRKAHAHDAFFRPIDPTAQNDPVNDNVGDRMMESNPNNSQTRLNSPFDSSTFPRLKKDDQFASSTLPRARFRKGSARGFPHEYPNAEADAFGPSCDATQTREIKFDWLTLPLPPYVSNVPETRLPTPDPTPDPAPARDPTPDPTLETHLPSATSDDVTSTTSKEDKVPRKRMKTLIGQFERSLLFLKPSSSGSRPNSVHWEDEFRDLTSPLAVERSRKKKKRPRPWSLPAGLEIHPVVVTKNHRRGQKQILFNGHPSLHILPPFTTDEEEEEEAGEDEVEAIKIKKLKEQEEKATNLVMVSEEDVEIPADASTPWLKRFQKGRQHQLISSFQEDAPNLITPFICCHDDQDNGIGENEESPSDLGEALDDYVMEDT